ncbi:MAG: naiP [Verrucomicrobiales bacterium]|nr:naiP [Verrucomicrobiales bacterium]
MLQSEVKNSTATSSLNLSRGKWLVLIAAFLGWMFDGLEMGIFPLVARPALQDLLHVTDDKLIGQWMGYITALFLVGAAFGGFIFGWLGDRVGRVRAMTLSVLTYSIFSGLCYFATVPAHLGIFRFLSALGMGGEWALGVALVMECWPQNKRPLLAGLIGAAGNAGYVLIALLGIKFKVTVDSWRWVMLAGAAPAVLSIFINFFVPESERWKEAAKKDSSSPLKEIFSARLRKATLIGIALASVALIGTWGSVQWLPLWADQMAGSTMPKAKAYTQIAAAVGAMFGCFGGSLLAGKMGRRPAYFLLCLGSLGICAYLFRFLHEFNALFLVTVFFTGAITAAFYGWTPLYLPELFPTRVRATGQGLSYNFGRILAAVGVLQMGSLMQHYNGSYAKAGATISLIYIVGMGIIWLAPETKGRPLPE